MNLLVSHNPEGESRRARLLATISTMPPIRHEGLRRESALYAFLISQGARGYDEAAEVLLLAKYGCTSPLVAYDRESRTWRGVAWRGGRVGSLLKRTFLRRVIATLLQFL